MWFEIHFIVVVKRIDGDRQFNSARKVLTANIEASLEHLPRQDTWQTWTESKSFIDNSVKVAAAIKCPAQAYIIN